MSGRAAYTPHHPRWLRRRVSTYWWLGRWSYLAFILRELSSLFIAWFVVYLLLLIRAMSGGDASYQEFLAWSARPGVLLLNVVTLFFVFFHALTWFNLAPKAMVVHVRGKRLPGALIAIANYGAWVVVSAFLVWVLLAGSNG
ncbi:MAG: fumarate reductase subunit C [Gemmatimonadaceae bacterium]